MDIKTLGGKGWNDGNTTRPTQGVAGFMEDTSPTKAGLLQASRARNTRQFMVDKSKEKELETSNSMSVLETTGKSSLETTVKSSLETTGKSSLATTGKLPKKSSPEKAQFSKRLSTNPSRNNPPGTSYTVQERPPSRVEIDYLEDELSERLRTVTDLAGTELRALDIGDMYQPHKDTMMLIKTRVLEDFSVSDDQYKAEPWFESYIKCECLREVSEEVANQLADMVSVSSISLGNVLRKLKFAYKTSYVQMKKSWCDLRRQFVENEKELMEKRKQVDNMAADMEIYKKELRQKNNQEIAELNDAFENVRERDKERIIAADFHVEQMAGTLKSLNGIFKTMQTDGQAVTFADLTFKCNRLEGEVENLTEQCQTLDILKSELRTSEERVNALERLLHHKTEECTVLQSQLYKRDQSVAILMEREALRNSEIDKLQNMVSGKDGNNLDELEEPPTSVLCIRCKKSLDDLGNLRDVVYGATKTEDGDPSKKVQCESFRILLPHLRGRPPSHRPIPWLRFAMRNIIVSKMKQDVTLLTIKGDVTRFPEYSYTWFERIPPATITAGVKANTISTSNKHIKTAGVPFVSAVTLGQQADDDRWAMFDGVKKLSKKDPEAKLFWALLDETYGEDGMQFVLYCLSVVLSISGFQLWRQFGNCFKNDNCNSYSMAFEPSNLENFNNPTMNKHGHDHRRGPNSRASSSRAASRPVSPRTHSSHGHDRHHDKHHDKHDIHELHHNGHHPTHPSLTKAVPPMGNNTIYLDMVSACNAVKIILVKALQPQLQHAIDAMDALSEVPPTHEEPMSLASPMGNPVPVYEHEDEDGEEVHRHICLFTWLRIMLCRFSDDRSHREASVVSMFEVASVANLSTTATAAIAANNSSDSITAAVDFQPFQSICKTLCPEISTGDMVSLFTQSYAQDAKKCVSAKAFLKVADRKNFFSRCLRLSSLPLFSEHTPQKYISGIFPDELLSEENTEDPIDIIHKAIGFSNTFAVRSQVGSLIHRKLAIFSFGFEQLLLDCPEKHRCMLQEAYDMVAESLSENSSSTLRHRRNADGKPVSRAATATGGKPQLTLQETSSNSKEPNKHLFVDGMQPLVHYRRLLSTALLVRCLTQNPIVPGSVLTGMQHNTLPHLDLKFQKIDMVLSLMERAVQADCPGGGKAVSFDKARLNLVVRKVQHVFRHFTYNQAPPVPRVVRFFMRPGYLRGTTLVKKRQIVAEPWWAQTAIAEIYTFKITYDTKAVKLGQPPIELYAAVASYFYHRFGLLDISERMIHDLYVCVQAYHYCLPRLRMFGAFSGCGSLEEPVASIMKSAEAQGLYLDLLMRVHKQIDTQATADHFADMDADVAAETMRLQSTTANNGTEYAKVLGVFHVPFLFPTSVKNVVARPDKKDVWMVPATVLDVAATKWATVGCLKSGGTSGGSAPVTSLANAVVGEQAAPVAAGPVTDAMVYGQLTYKLRMDKENRADVDDFLWLCMIHWAKCTAAYQKKSAVRAGFFERSKKQQAAKLSLHPGNPPMFTSMGLTDLCQSIYGAASQSVNGAPAITVDSQHVASLYVNHVVKRSEPETLEQMMKKSVTWDTSSRIASSGAHQEELPLMKTGVVGSRFYHCTETACHILNGMSEEGIMMLHDSADDVLPLRYNCHILQGGCGILSIEMARRSFQHHHAAINEMTDNLGKLNYDVKTEVDRMIHTLRRNILQLEVNLDEPAAAVAADGSLDRVHAVWSALCSLYAVVHEISSMVGIPFPQDICGVTRKLHLERSPVFSVQTSVTV